MSFLLNNSTNWCQQIIDFFQLHKKSSGPSLAHTTRIRLFIQFAIGCFLLGVYCVFSVVLSLGEHVLRVNRASSCLAYISQKFIPVPCSTFLLSRSILLKGEYMSESFSYLLSIAL